MYCLCVCALNGIIFIHSLAFQLKSIHKNVCNSNLGERATDHHVAAGDANDDDMQHIKIYILFSWLIAV